MKQHEDCFVGVGETEHAAIDDALDLAWQDGWYVDDWINNGDDTKTAPKEMNYYATLYVS